MANSEQGHGNLHEEASYNYNNTKRKKRNCRLKVENTDRAIFRTEAHFYFKIKVSSAIALP